MSADVYCQNQNAEKSCISMFYSRMERRGNRLVARETESESVCVTLRCQKMKLASVVKRLLGKGLP